MVNAKFAGLGFQAEKKYVRNVNTKGNMKVEKKSNVFIIENGTENMGVGDNLIMSLLQNHGLKVIPGKEMWRKNFEKLYALGR